MIHRLSKDHLRHSCIIDVRLHPRCACAASKLPWSGMSFPDAKSTASTATGGLGLRGALGGLDGLGELCGLGQDQRDRICWLLFSVCVFLGLGEGGAKTNLN